jgi:hypothetical protein
MPRSKGPMFTEEVARYSALMSNFPIVDDPLLVRPGMAAATGHSDFPHRLIPNKIVISSYRTWSVDSSAIVSSISSDLATNLPPL